MQRKKHYFMTCAALLFLGLIVLKPRSYFEPVQTKNAVEKSYDHRIKFPVVKYEYN